MIILLGDYKTFPVSALCRIKETILPNWLCCRKTLLIWSGFEEVLPVPGSGVVGGSGVLTPHSGVESAWAGATVDLPRFAKVARGREAL